MIVVDVMVLVIARKFLSATDIASVTRLKLDPVLLPNLLQSLTLLAESTRTIGRVHPARRADQRLCALIFRSLEPRVVAKNLVDRVTRNPVFANEFSNCRTNKVLQPDLINLIPG